MILKEVREWVEESKTAPADYKELVMDHNYNWCTKFNPTGAFHAEMVKVEQELKEIFAAMKNPFDPNFVPDEKKMEQTPDDAIPTDSSQKAAEIG